MDEQTRERIVTLAARVLDLVNQTAHEARKTAVDAPYMCELLARIDVNVCEMRTVARQDILKMSA